MNWDKLDIHIENLIPGLATVWALSLHWKLPAIQSDVSKVVLGTALLGVAYLTGVIVNVMCRILIDPPSEYITRHILFRMFAKTKLRDMKGATIDEINYAYTYYCGKAIKGSEETSKEVAKRRQTGRLIRSALIPLVITVLYIAKLYSINLVICLISIFFVYLLLLFLYGYAEVIILQEAYHAVPENERSVLVIKKIRKEKEKEIKEYTEQNN